MLALCDFSFDFGGRRLYDKANFFLKEGEKVALVGKNGTGKSTFLKILTGEYALAEGTYSRPKNLKIAFFHQDLLSVAYDASIYEVALGAFEEALRLQQEIRALYEQLELQYTEELWMRLSRKEAEWEAAGGKTIEQETKQTLAGLGFSEELQHKPYHTLSGGWRMRVLLTKMLLQKPALLLLDEPTNHLDLPSVQWLEDYLIQFQGSLIIVSHDRYFLERTTQRTVEIANQKFFDYAGNYAFYLEEKARREKVQQAAYENQQEFIKKQEQFIERFRAKATKASQAQSKIKLLEKLERVQPVQKTTDKIKFRFSIARPSGTNVLYLDIKQKAYDGKCVLRDSQVAVRRGDKIGLIGANGIGKSTLLRIIYQKEPFEGKVEYGHQVIPAFFAQHQLEALNLHHTLLQEFHEAILQRGEAAVRSILGGFLFTGDDVEKKIQVLSGGEKARVALIKILLSGANFLLLDEPTNHLDIESIAVLTQALQEYEGTYIVVSHDRYFLEKVTNKIWYIEQQTLKEYPGSFLEFQDHQASRLLAQPHSVKQVTKQEKPSQAVSSYAEQKKLKSDIRRLEKQITEYEARLQQLTQQYGLQEVASDYQKVQELQREQTQMEEKLLSLYEELDRLERCILR